MDPKKAPKRFVFVGKRVWNVEGVRVAMARSNYKWSRRENRLLGMIHQLESSVARRDRSLDKAHEYIELLKKERKPITAYQAPEFDDSKVQKSRRKKS